MRFWSVWIGAALAAAAPGLAVGARADDCAAPIAAMIKYMKTPNHTTVADAAGTDEALNDGTSDVSEMITTPDKIYIRIKGAWHAMPRDSMNPDDIATAAASGAYTCTVLRDETVDGEATTVYHVDDQSDPDTKQDQTVWVAKASGLPVRVEINQDVGGGDAGKSHSVMTIDYQNVTAPAGVN